MRRPVVAVLTLAGLLCVKAAVLAQRGRFGEQGAGRNGWLSSLRTGKQQARMSGKPLMVVLRCEP